MNTKAIIPFVLHVTIWIIVRPMAVVFGSLRIVGKRNIRGHKNGVIFAINHLSEFDTVLMPAVLGPFSGLLPIFSVARERSFYPRAQKGGIVKYIYGGTLFRMLGAYPAYAGKGDYEHALQHHIGILERGGTMGIFPEGKRNLEGVVGEGKPGVAYLMWRTGKPVVPTVIRGHYGMRPREFFARKHTIEVRYGKPITREELFGAHASDTPPSREELIAATAVIMSRIREMYHS